MRAAQFGQYSTCSRSELRVAISSSSNAPRFGEPPQNPGLRTDEIRSLKF